MIDIVFPDGNEKEFVEIAEKLGFKALCFVYPKGKDLSELQKKTKLKLYSGSFYPNISFLTMAKGSENTKDVMEKGKIDLVYDLELSTRKDSVHSRRSGLDNVMCSYARKKDILIAFNFNSVLKSKGMRKGLVMGRMTQNFRLCRKHKVKSVIASFASLPYEMRDFHELMSFGIVLGMHPKEAKDSLNNALDKIKNNLKKKSPKYIAEGLEKL